MSSVRELIKEKRIELGLSQADLGRKCHLTDTEICKIEKGERKKVGWENLCKIAQGLSIHPFEFLLAEGYIAESDIHPVQRLRGLDALNQDDLLYLQMFIDGILSDKAKKNKQEAYNNEV